MRLTPLALTLAGAAIVTLTAGPVAAAPAATDAAYRQQIEKLRADRETQLKQPDAWLALIGRHWLVPGVSTVGSAADNAVVLAKGPAHLGSVDWTPNGEVRLTLLPEANATIDGDAKTSAVLVSDIHEDRPPTQVRFGSTNFHLIERGDRRALRVFDPDSEILRNFTGIDYFPIDPSWQVTARWVPFDPPRELKVTNQIGQVTVEKVLGKAVFERNGQTFELTPIPDGSEPGLFFVMADRTSTRETYGGARFLNAEPPKDGRVTLDFNLARNPPCAFTPYTTCPLAPKENRLKIAVTAGEKKYRGGPH